MTGTYAGQFVMEASVCVFVRVERRERGYGGFTE